MMKVRYLSAASAATPQLRPAWKRGDGDVVLANPPYGTIVHLVMCDEEGRALYDQPAWAEPEGAIAVPVTADGKLVLVENVRPLLPRLHVAVYPPGALDDRGGVSLEFPRGFPQPGEPAEAAARREVEEETGMAVGAAQRLGECNANTATQMTNIPVFLVRVTDRPSAARLDLHEEIKGHRIVAVPEILALCREGQIVCALTKAALLHYLATRGVTA